MFKITHLEIEPCKSCHDMGALRVHVKWTCREEDLSYFGTLNEFSQALVIPDIEAYKKHYEEAPEPFQDDDFVPVEGRPDWVEWKPKHPSPFDLDLIKRMPIQGCGHINPVEGEENTYEYEEYVVDSHITQACIMQMDDMKKQIDEGICMFGDYPDQVGCFRSGDVLSDFVAVLQSLDMFWD